MPDKIDILCSDVAEMKASLSKIDQALRGYNGQNGLIKSHHDLKADYYKFKRNMFLIVGLLIGSGALGIGAWQIFA